MLLTVVMHLWIIAKIWYPGIKLGSPALQVGSLPTELSGKLSYSKISIWYFSNLKIWFEKRKILCHHLSIWKGSVKAKAARLFPVLKQWWCDWESSAMVLGVLVWGWRTGCGKALQRGGAWVAAKDWNLCLYFHWTWWCFLCLSFPKITRLGHTVPMVDWLCFRVYSLCDLRRLNSTNTRYSSRFISLIPLLQQAFKSVLI